MEELKVVHDLAYTLLSVCRVFPLYPQPVLSYGINSFEIFSSFHGFSVYSL